MPLYPYRCKECGHRFEKIQSFNAEPEKECPKCQGQLERPLTAPALQFKGAGWYVNDYAGGNSTATTSDSSTAKVADAAPAACAGCPKNEACSTSYPLQDVARRHNRDVTLYFSTA